MAEDAGAAADARKYTRVGRPIHRDRFMGVRRMKRRRFGSHKRMGGTRYTWTPPGKWVRA